jgi:hypothetical protein
MRALTPCLLSEPSGTRRRLAELGDDGRPGQPIALRGFNLSGAAKNVGVPFSNALAPDIVARAQGFLPAVAADGFDLLRVPIVWEFLQEQPGAELNAQVGAAVRALVEYAGRLGFRVIVDIHQDVLGSYYRDGKDPTMHGDGLPPWAIALAYAPAPGQGVPQEWKDTVLGGGVGPRHWALNYAFNGSMRRAMTGLSRPASLDAFRDFAARLAALLAGLDNILTYEVINEPLSDCVSPDAHVALASAVRAGLGGGVRDGATPTWSVMPAGDWLDTRPTVAHVLPQVDTNRVSIMSRSSLPPDALQHRFGGGYWLLTPHFYDPRAGTPGSDPEPARYEAAVAAAESLMGLWSVVPVVGEFGCGADKPQRDACHRQWIDCFERRCWSWCLWDFNPDAAAGGDDRWCHERLSVAEGDEDGEVRRTSAYAALLRPFPRRYGAPLLASSWDGARYIARFGASFVAGWRTEIYVPQSLGDFTVTGGDASGRLVSVDTDSGEREIAIELAGS